MKKLILSFGKIFVLLSTMLINVNAGPLYEAIKSRIEQAAKCDNSSSKYYISNVTIDKVIDKNNKVKVEGIITKKLVNNNITNRLLHGGSSYKRYYRAEFKTMLDSVVLKRFCASLERGYDCTWNTEECID